MSTDDDSSPVKPTIIDLDPDQVTEEGKPAPEPKRDATAEPSSEPTAEKPKTDRVRKDRTLPIAAAALAIGAVAGGWIYRDGLSQYFPTDEMRVLTERSEALGKANETMAAELRALERLTTQLKTDIDSIEDAATASRAESKTLADGLAATKSSMAQLEAGLAETKSSLAEIAARPVVSADGTVTPAIPADLANRIAALEKDVANLKAAGGTAADISELSQSLSDLKAKIEQGVGFAVEQERIARMVPAAQGLDVLVAHAEKGLPNAAGLAAELKALRAGLPVPAAPPAPEEEAGWWDSLVGALSSIITIREEGEADWQQVADKAIALSEAGDLEQAIAVIDETEGATPAGLQQWRDRAGERIKLEAALTTVSDAVSRTLAARP